MEESLYETLAQSIRTRRKALGMTQEALAEKAHVSASFIGHIETASRVPSIQTLYHIALALGVSLDALFENPQQKNRLPALKADSAVLNDISDKLDELLLYTRSKRFRCE